MAQLLDPHLRAQVDAIEQRLDDMETRMSDAIRQGVVEGMRELLRDDEAIAGFWARGYKELTQHTSANASQWIGRRILTAIMVAVFVGSVTWLVKSGNLK